MAEVALEQVYKAYADGTTAVADLSLRIGDGEFVVLVGPSGCGKTTALRMVAGLEDISAGTIRIGDRIVNDVRPKNRDVAMVFQNYALYPHLSVADNIGFGLKLRKVDKAEIRRRVQGAADVLGLGEYLGRKPRALSGGQRQRVAMGRAIVREPQVFLMDEPLSNLDAKLRVQMRAEISGIQKRLGTTTLYVTHDQVEAMTMGDRVAVMRKGLLQQVAPPQELYDHPVNLFVGGFIGSPAMNMAEAVVHLDGGGPTVTFGSTTLGLPDGLLARKPGLGAYDGRKVALGIRPEDLEDSVLEPGAPADRRLRGTAGLVEALGSELLVHFGVDAAPVLTEDTKELASDTHVLGPEELERESRSGTTGFVARLSPQSRIREDGSFELNVETDRLHFFDLDTGLAIGEGPRAGE